MSDQLSKVVAEMRTTPNAFGWSNRTVLQWADRIEAATPKDHPSRGVVDEAMVERAMNADAEEYGASIPASRVRRILEAAVLQAAALPAVPEGANGKAFSVGDRVVWTSRFGREFTGVVESVIEPVPTRYTVKLDDGLHADCDAWNLAATPAHDQPEGADND